MKTPVNTPLASARTHSDSSHLGSAAQSTTLTSRSGAGSTLTSRGGAGSAVLPLIECRRMEQLVTLSSSPRSSVTTKYEPATVSYNKHGPASRRSTPRTKPLSSIKHTTKQPPSAQNTVYDSECAYLSRSKSRLQMIIRDELPSRDDGNQDTPQSPNPIPAEIYEMIDKLKTQVADLSLYLEEERLNHRETRRRAEELMRDKIDQMKFDEKEALFRQQTLHQDEIEVLKSKYQQEMESERRELNKQISKLGQDLEVLQGAFHTYKSETAVTHKTDLEELESETTQRLQAYHQREIRHVESNLRSEMNEELNSVEHKYASTMNELKTEHKKHTEALKRRYAKHDDDLLELKVTRQRLDEALLELESMTNKANKLEQESNDMKLKYSDSKMLLLGHESLLEDKVADIEAKYKSHNDNLLQDNSMLRIQYLRKCEELFDVTSKVEIERQQEEQAKWQPSTRSKRLERTQSLLDAADMESRGYAKNLFSQLHVHDLNMDLEWWLETTNQAPVSPLFPVPMNRVYEEVVLNSQERSASRQRESTLPALPTCHRSRNIGQLIRHDENDKGTRRHMKRGT